VKGELVMIATVARGGNLYWFLIGLEAERSTEEMLNAKRQEAG
jgi:hypothetical protein